VIRDSRFERKNDNGKGNSNSNRIDAKGAEVAKFRHVKRATARVREEADSQRE
jgi:hypothetical protein